LASGISRNGSAKEER
jgi:hypothetical protein